MRVWVFKVNTKRGWEFDEYFRSRTCGPYEMGDEGWIRSASSLRYLREEVKRGDLFLCYEVDRKQVELDEPIKQLGSYQVTVRLAPEVKAQIQVEVVPENP